MFEKCPHTIISDYEVRKECTPQVMHKTFVEIAQFKHQASFTSSSIISDRV